MQRKVQGQRQFPHGYKHRITQYKTKTVNISFTVLLLSSINKRLPLLNEWKTFLDFFVQFVWTAFSQNLSFWRNEDKTFFLWEICAHDFLEWRSLIQTELQPIFTWEFLIIKHFLWTDCKGNDIKLIGIFL